jgi:hypothetical protein
MAQNQQRQQPELLPRAQFAHWLPVYQDIERSE